MQLTRTIPTKPGYYWASFCPHDMTPAEPVPVELILVPSGLVVVQFDAEFNTAPDRFYWGDEITREPIGLKLSPARQSWLAEVASKARTVLYDWDSHRESPDYEDLGEWFALHAIDNRGNFSPQDFDDMYDRLHRSGSNA